MSTCCCCCGNDGTAHDPQIPSPGQAFQANKVIRMTDEGISEYIEFPSDTIFMESLAHNAQFRAGVAYVPVQRTTGPDSQPESHIYEVRVGRKSTVTHVLGPLTTEDGSTAITVFGSALTKDGFLYLCCFNRNSILVYDLQKTVKENQKNADKNAQKPKLVMEIENVASPNDICVDPNDETVVYVAGGTFHRLYMCCCLDFTNPAYGQIFRVQVNLNDKKAAVKSFQKGLDVLAGIEVINGKLWVAELYRIFELGQDKGRKVETKWKGNDHQGNVWLADNVETFENDWILCPAYSTASELIVNGIIKRNCLSSTASFWSQLATAYLRGESIQDALQDPEVSLAFSNTYIQKGQPDAPVRFVIMSPTDHQKAFHFEIDLKQTRKKNGPREVRDLKSGSVLGQRQFFNEQVTHMSHIKSADSKKGFLVCVNFEQPRILLLKDQPFRQATLTEAKIS